MKTLTTVFWRIIMGLFSIFGLSRCQIFDILKSSAVMILYYDKRYHYLFPNSISEKDLTKIARKEEGFFNNGDAEWLNFLENLFFFYKKEIDENDLDFNMNSIDLMLSSEKETISKSRVYSAIGVLSLKIIMKDPSYNVLFPIGTTYRDLQLFLFDLGLISYNTWKKCAEEIENLSKSSKNKKLEDIEVDNLLKTLSESSSSEEISNENFVSNSKVQSMIDGLKALYDKKLEERDSEIESLRKANEELVEKVSKPNISAPLLSEISKLMPQVREAIAGQRQDILEIATSIEDLVKFITESNSAQGSSLSNFISQYAPILESLSFLQNEIAGVEREEKAEEKSGIPKPPVIGDLVKGKDFSNPEHAGLDDDPEKTEVAMPQKNVPDLDEEEQTATRTPVAFSPKTDEDAVQSEHNAHNTAQRPSVQMMMTQEEEAEEETTAQEPKSEPEPIKSGSNWTGAIVVVTVLVVSVALIGGSIWWGKTHQKIQPTETAPQPQVVEKIVYKVDPSCEKELTEIKNRTSAEDYCRVQLLSPYVGKAKTVCLPVPTYK